MSVLTANYVELKNDYEIVNYWIKIGFLDGLTEPIKTKTAKAYQLACYLLNKRIIKVKNDKTESIIYPIIRRVLTNENNGILVDEFEFTNEKMIELIQAVDECINVDDYKNNRFDFIGIDIEAELVCNFCQIYVKSENLKIKTKNEKLKKESEYINPIDDNTIPDFYKNSKNLIKIDNKPNVDVEKKWVRTGFLDDVDEEMKFSVASGFELAESIMLSHVDLNVFWAVKRCLIGCGESKIKLNSHFSFTEDKMVDLINIVSENDSLDRWIIQQNETPQLDLEWDYLGYKKFSDRTYPETQNDWNQTFITTINQLSHQIERKFGVNADKIIVNPIPFVYIVNLLVFYELYEPNTIGHKYKVEIDKSLPINKVIVKLNNSDGIFGTITIKNI
jgi:hypothetical protein